MEDLDRRLDQLVETPVDLSRVLRVVVPSSILRGHLAGRLVSRRGAALGLIFQTLDGFVQELLESDSRHTSSDGDAVFSILVRNVAETYVESSDGKYFAESLSEFEGRFGSLTESVADLLDAGLTDAHLDALRESLQSKGSGDVAKIAMGILDISGGVRESFRSLGLNRRSDRYERAKEIIESSTNNCRSKAIWIYGFADVTGVQGDVLEALLRYTNAQIFIDQGVETSPFAGGRKYLDRLVGRLSGVRGKRSIISNKVNNSTHEWSRTSSFRTECVQVVNEVSRLIEQGVLPEEIIITARNLESHIQHLTREMRARGLPYSIAQKLFVETEPVRRRILALLELHRLGQDASLDVWSTFVNLDADLQYELRPWSAKRLKFLSSVPPKRLSKSANRVWENIQKFVFDLAEEPASSPFIFYKNFTLEFFPDDNSELKNLIERKLDEVSKSVPKDFRLRREDFIDLLDIAVAEIGLKRNGETGGGVQLMSVTEARGVTCEHLFVLGMNKGIFPRIISEDPLLSDAFRSSLLNYLPELPIKGRGKDEDRYLAAQLADAAPKVYWSYSQRDEEGLELSVSPLLEQLFFFSEPETFGPQEAELIESSEGGAIRGGLDGDKELHKTFLTAALIKVASQFKEIPPGNMQGIAEFRQELGRKVDSPRLVSSSPWGKIKFSNSPKLSNYVTKLEDLLKCPWKYFIENVLQFSSREKILDELPAFNPRMIGNGVHRILQRIGENGGVPSRVSFSSLESGQQVNWPDAQQFDKLLKETVNELLLEDGIYLPGFDRALMEWIRAHVLNVRTLDPEGLKWFGVEIDGTCSVPSLEGGILQFRVDRVEELEGKKILTDFKAGVKRATGLQAKAYSRAVSPGRGEGRYFYTNPRHSILNQSPRVEKEKDLRVLDEAGEVATEIWKKGMFSPRLTKVNGSEPDLCSYCGVRELCWRRGSEERRAYQKFMDTEESSSLLRKVFEVKL